MPLELTLVSPGPGEAQVALTLRRASKQQYWAAHRPELRPLWLTAHPRLGAT
jgi:hypothetical protein